MNEFLKNDIEFFITIGSAIMGVIVVIIGILRYFHKQKIERLQDQHKLEIEKSKTGQEKEELKKPLIQEEKVVYVKYLYIRKQSEPPVYKKLLKRTEEYIDIHSEYHYYRFNKYNTKKNSITIMDASSGAVDLNIIFPWRDLIFTDIPRKKKKDIITQELTGSDTYFTVTTYYNGFNEGNEDIAMKMEMDTQNTRLIADFSSIVGVDRLFTKEPDVYRIKPDGSKNKILGLEEINEGIFHIHANNLKKNEVLFLDFHVNWDFLNDKKNKEEI